MEVCNQNLKVKRIAVGSIYVSPRSQHKVGTIEHIIESIHVQKAQDDNEINFCIGGDFNRLDISDILDSYGGQKQIISVPTRKTATLSNVLTDLHSFSTPQPPFHPYKWTLTKRGKMGTLSYWHLRAIHRIQWNEQRKLLKQDPFLNLSC